MTAALCCHFVCKICMWSHYTISYCWHTEHAHVIRLLTYQCLTEFYVLVYNTLLWSKINVHVSRFSCQNIPYEHISGPFPLKPLSNIINFLKHKYVICSS